MAALQGRYVHIHPTLRCNLRCRHCYSSSGPDKRDALPLPPLQRALDDASAEGYVGMAVSGGEPLLYPKLSQLLKYAQGCGLRTAVTSNGMLLDARRLDALAGVTDVIAISIDGVPAAHNLNRGHARAFERMESRLDAVRASGIPFGFVFTLTQHNLHELDWILDFALQQQAMLLHIHPLEGAGRALVELPDAIPDCFENACALLYASRLQHRALGRLSISIDLFHRETVRSNPEMVFADKQERDEGAAPLANLVAPLVVEADGVVSPISYGFPRSFSLGTLFDAPLARLIASWRRHCLPAFHLLCRAEFAAVTADSALPFFNWHEALTARAAGLRSELLVV